MRMKDVLRRLPFSSRIRLVYERITLTRYTTCYISLVLAVCVVQTVLHSFVLANNTRAKYLVGRIITEVGEPAQYAFVKNDVLMVCDRLPLPGDADACWPLTSNISDTINAIHTTNGASNHSSAASDSYYRRSISGVLTLENRHTVEPEFDANGTLQEVVVSNLADDRPPVALSPQCIQALQWPNILLHEAMSEDVILLAFQLWLFGMALMTVLNQSIPHLVAAFAGLMLSTGWNAFQIHRNNTFKQLFKTLVADDQCDGEDLLGSYWSKRNTFFVSILTVGVVSLLVVSYLSFSLFKVYAQQSFKLVGANKKLNTLYKIILVFAVFLQLSVFFTITSSAMWVDELCTGAIRKMVENGVGYIVVFSITCAMELPWLITGWLAIRQENRILTWLFFGVGVFLINSPFFATMTITAFLILITTLVLAIVCRLNFGKGLLEFLRMEETFDHFDFETVLPEVKCFRDEGDLGGIEEDESQQRQSAEESSDKSFASNGAKRISSAVRRMSRQLFGSDTSTSSYGLSIASLDERKNINPYARAREMDKQRSAAEVVDIQQPPVSLAALSSSAAFNLNLKRTLSSTSASRAVAQGSSWSVADRETAPVPPIPFYVSSMPSSVRSSSESERRDSRQSTVSLSKLKRLQLPPAANSANGLAISPDPFRSEGMKSGWY